MAEPTRTYEQALACLDKLQSNQATVAMVADPYQDMNKFAISEMIGWVKKAGYSVDDFNRLRIIHVAGTKGKGSVCAMIDSILNEYVAVQKRHAVGSEMNPSGTKQLGRVGLYTSPHLITPRERIRLDGKPISQKLFAKYFFELWDTFTASATNQRHPNPAGVDTKPAYFRYLTIMALHVFLREGVETAIMECGIGGEYDSTNILSAEAVTVSIITKLGIDHVGMLGDSIDKIAWHKSGIMRNGVKCFTVPQLAPALSVLQSRGAESGAMLMVVNVRSEIADGAIQLKLQGEFQKDNASLAIAATGAHLKQIGYTAVLETKPPTIPLEFQRGLEHVSWDGRCQVRKEGNIEWHIDGAHTKDSLYEAAKWFVDKWQANGRKPAMLIFNSQLRDAPELARSLHESLERTAGAGSGGVFEAAAFAANTPFTADVVAKPAYPDVQVQRDTANAWKQLRASERCSVHGSVEGAVEEARQVARARFPETYQVLVTGSLHLVGGFLRVLGTRPEDL